MGLKDIFKKQGGMSLIKKYVKGGALFTALVQFAILGKSRTALEILRLSAQFKIRRRLEKKYKNILIDFDRNFDNNLIHNKSNKLWICWFQGIENAPELVKKCFSSVCDNLTGRDITLITSDNMSDYVEFPDFIMEKWKKGIISHTHMTDLLRLELLIKYGGMWLDATVFCTEREENIADYFFESDLFLFQCLKPGRDGHSIAVSSWLMSAKTNNKILMAARYLCYEYWKNNSSMVDYFLIHHFISIAMDYYTEESKNIVPRDNAAPHILLLRLFDKYDENMWNTIKAQTPFHKMTYKFKKEQTELENTYYDVIFK